jgi:hypothetical protein
MKQKRLASAHIQVQSPGTKELQKSIQEARLQNVIKMMLDMRKKLKIVVN